jgi:glycosyltransferase involved in cell wall biosynthesis
LEESVRLPGFVPYDFLPVYYGLAAALVHPSTTEQWGLVVNEAMASGLPVVVSERCGCVPELLVPGRNGGVFDPLDEDSMVSEMLALSSLSDSLEAMGAESRRIVADFGLERFARGFDAAVTTAVSGGSRRPQRLVDRAALAILRGTR